MNVKTVVRSATGHSRKPTTGITSACLKASHTFAKKIFSHMFLILSLFIIWKVSWRRCASKCRDGVSGGCRYRAVDRHKTADLRSVDIDLVGLHLTIQMREGVGVYGSCFNCLRFVFICFVLSGHGKGCRYTPVPHTLCCRDRQAQPLGHGATANIHRNSFNKVFKQCITRS